MESSPILGSQESGSQSFVTKLKSHIKIRFIHVALILSGLLVAHAMRANLGVAIVQMVENRTVSSSSGVIYYQEDFDWSPKEQGVLLSAFYWCYTFNQLPGGLLAFKFGGKFIFGVSIFATAVCTCLTPPAATYGGYYAVFVMRALQGLFEGMSYPAATQLCSWWTPRLERTIIIAISFSGGTLGTATAMALSGIIAHSLGWPSIYYFFGTVGIIWTILWIFLTSETPEKHPLISADELQHIQATRQLSAVEFNRLRDVPWCHILTSVPVWAVSVAMFAEYWGYYTMQSELPSYMSQVLHFDIRQIGILAALPYFTMFAVTVSSSHVTDFVRRKNYMSSTNIRKLFIFVGFCLQFIFLLLISYSKDASVIIILLCLGIGSGGLALPSFNGNVLDLSQRYATFVMVIANTFSNLPGMLAPVVTSFLVSASVDNWAYVFLISSLFYLSGALFFAMFGSADTQPWND